MLIKILFSLLAGVFMLASGGCAVILEDGGEIEFTFGTSLGVKHHASGTGQKSVARIESQSIEKWLTGEIDRVPPDNEPGVQPDMEDPP